MLETAKQLRRYQLHALDGPFGRIGDLYIDDARWCVRYVVANTGTWLLGRKLLLAPESLEPPIPETRVVHVRLTKEQIEKSPRVEADEPLSQQVEAMLAKYFGWYPWWTGGGLIPAAPTPLAPPPPPLEYPDSRTPVEGQGPCLRSANEVIGYTIQAIDDEIGHVDDVIVDAEKWVVRYLAVDTRKFWPGRHILVTPEWIRFVRWADQKVTVTLSKYEIERSPEYDASRPITRDYESALYRHFGKPPYWEE